ncbi:M10 family metallopeptidase [Ramlibacter sp.]|uniref:M10 family metallopeptidase n=1 Tax=Ramlibacter sp. TaxID=1917967 RepID=UPI003D0B1797
MATPSSGLGSIEQALGADPTVNALLYGTRWASGAVSYSFLTSTSSFSTDPTIGYGSPSAEPWSFRFGVFGSQAQAAATSALAKWANVAQITFQLLPDSGNTCGDIRFGFSDIGDAQAHAYSPGQASGGDVWFSYTERSRSFAEGTYNYLTMVHETGHALGLKHPFSGVPGNAAVLGAALDNLSNTVMSYSAASGDIDSDFTYRPTTPMRLDILAMQQLYGANASYNAGDSAYVFAQGADYHQTVWDGGGIDAFSYSGADNCVIDLRSGAGSTMGNAVFVLNAVGARTTQVSNIWIADAATIENATGGAGNDRVTGNGVANKLDGGAGTDTLQGAAANDRIEGGAGVDIALYGGAAADYVVLFNSATGRYTVADRLAARDGIDVVSGVEQFQFSDGARGASALAIAAPVQGTARIVLGISEAFYGFAPGSSQYQASATTVATEGASAFALAVGRGFTEVPSAQLAADVLLRLGIEANTLGGAVPGESYTALRDAVDIIFTVYSVARGQVVLNLVNLLANLEGDAVYGQAAATLAGRLTIDYNNLGPVALAGIAEPAWTGV